MGFCQNCGAELADGIKYCPECGGTVNVQEPAYSGVYTEHNTDYNSNLPYSGLAIAGFVLGIVGFFVPFIPSILAIVFGFIGRAQCKNHERKGNGFAITAIILGIIYFALMVIVVVIALCFANTALQLGGLGWMYSMVG